MGDRERRKRTSPSQRVELARAGRLPDPRRGHVGYYLVDAGRRALEDRLGYRPAGLERVRRAITRHPTLSVPLWRSRSLTGAAPLRPRAVPRARRRTSASRSAVSVLLAIVPASIVARDGSCNGRWRASFRRARCPSSTSRRACPTTASARRDPDPARAARGRRRACSGRSSSTTSRTPIRRLEFALLTDDVDSETMPEDARAARERGARNRRAQREARRRTGAGPFHLLHREPRWNAGRGAVHGLGAQARKARGAQSPAPRGEGHELHAPRRGPGKGSSGSASSSRVDSDTQLPMGTARRLVGLLAHPLNRAVVRRRDRARRLGLHDRPAAHRDVPVELAPDALRADLRRRRRVRHLHARRLRVVSRPLRRRDLRRQRHLRRRRVHAQRRRPRPRECPRESRSLRGHPRANGARDRHRPLRGATRPTTRRTRGACTGGCAATGSSFRGSSPRCPSADGTARAEPARRRSTAGRSSTTSAGA